MKNALYVLRYAKSTSWANVTSNSEKIKLVMLVNYACLKASAGGLQLEKKNFMEISELKKCGIQNKMLSI